VAKRIKEKRMRLPTIEAETHFVKIGCEMLCTDPMPCSNNAALQKRESGFDCVGMNVTVNIDFRAVLDSFVFLGSDRSLFHCEGVGTEIVGHNHVNIFRDVLANEHCQRARLHILSMEESHITAALPQSDHDFLFRSSTTKASTAPATADIGFIHFYRAIHHGPIYFFHGSTDAMAEIPRGFVADSESSLNLVSGHSLPCFTEQEGGKEPFLQGKVGVVENRASGHGKLIVTAFAVKELLCGRQFNGWHLAAWTFNASRPAETHKQFATFFVSVKEVNNVN